MFPTNQMPVDMANANQESPANGQAEESYEIDQNAVSEVKDATADFNVIPPPPPAGTYPVRWKLGEKGVEWGGSKKAGTFLNVYLEGELIAEGTDYNNYSLREYMNNIYNKLKGTTELHHFMNCLGVPLAPSMPMKDIKTLVETTLANSPIGMAEIEWQAKEKNPNSRRADKNGYVTLKNAMRQFAKNPDGSYNNTTPSEIDGSPVPATAYVLRHLAK